MRDTEIQYEYQVYSNIMLNTMEDGTKSKKKKYYLYHEHLLIQDEPKSRHED